MSETSTRPESAAAVEDLRGPEQRVLVLAPFGYDASVVCRVLCEAGFDAESCPGVDELCAEIRQGAGAALLAEEALSDEGRRRLTAALAEQPAWSDFPLLVMISRTREDHDGWRALRGMEGTAHLTLLERPLHTAALLSAVRAAVQSRRRQYQVRDELAARERTEQSLARQREMLQRVFDTIPVMLVIWDPGLQRFTLNRHAEAVLGWSTAEANDGDFMAKVYPDPTYRAEVSAYMRSLAHGWREFNAATRDGAVVPADWANIQLADDTMIGVGIDLRERKRAEEALRESEWRLRRLIEGNIIGVVIANSDRIVEANDVFLAMIGRSREDLEAGRIDWHTITPPEHLARDQRGLRELREQGSCRPFEKEYLRNDGSRVPILIGATVLKRQPLSWMCFVLDLTELKRTEEALKKLNESLEEQVAARTAVAERRARDLRRLAAELSEAEHRERTRLARLLHDDLQQLLLAVKLRLPVLVEGDPDQLKQHVGRLDELVGDCLSTSRNLTQELSPPVLQCGTLAQVFVWLGEWFGEKHGLAVAVDTRGELPPAPEHLRVFLFQAARELLFNVVKHSGRMDARVGLSFEEGYLTVRVEDDGEGFDPEAVEVRLQRPEGFGLFHIRERLEALGGRLEILQGPRGGACFRMIVPVVEGTESPVEDVEPRRTEAVRSRVPHARAEGTPLRLLVVDDHQMVREGFAGLLNLQESFEVVGEAADGEEAVEQAEALCPDVVIIDVDLPNMNGIEATRRIKQLQPETVVVGLSLYDQEAAMRAMAEVGADAYVSKHVPAKDLVEAIRRACSPETDS